MPLILNDHNMLVYGSWSVFVHNGSSFFLFTELGLGMYELLASTTQHP